MDLQRTLVELLEEVAVEGTLAIEGVSGLDALGDLGAAADGDLEAADGPQQELHVPLQIPVVGIEHFRGAVDLGVADGDLALVALHSDGHGLGGGLLVLVGPNAEGDEAGIQLRNVLHVKVDTQILHVVSSLSYLRGDFRHDSVHIFPFLLHVTGQLHLGTGTDKIVFGVSGLKVEVAVQIIL